MAKYYYLLLSNGDWKHNSTVVLPKYVNDVDSAIDGKKNEKKLRANSIKIINAVAQNILTPGQGFNKFFLHFENALKNYKPTNPNGKNFVFTIPLNSKTKTTP